MRTPIGFIVHAAGYLLVAALLLAARAPAGRAQTPEALLAVLASEVKALRAEVT